MDAGVLEAVVGPIWVALGVIGHKVLSHAEEEAADETVQLGKRLLARLRRRGDSADGVRPQLEAAVADLASSPEDADFRAAVRAQVRKALSGADGVDDPQLVVDLDRLLRAAGRRASARGPGAVAVGHNEGIISTGSNARNEISRGRA